MIPSVFLHFMKNAMSTVGMFIALKTLRGLRADYVAAEQAGNVTKMEEILAYVGDVDVGDNCNIGCGAIFVNYNGKAKNRTKVGNNCFVGSNCNIVAPVTIADNSYICAGTTLTVDTEVDDFVIGRCRETIKKNRAHVYLGEDK